MAARHVRGELGFDMIQVPLADPSTANYVGAFATGRSCHDWAVILGDVMRAACSRGDEFNMFSIGGPSGGSLDNRCFSIRGRFLGRAGTPLPSFDRKVYIRCWEPGGGQGTLHGHGHAGDADDGQGRRRSRTSSSTWSPARSWASSSCPEIRASLRTAPSTTTTSCRPTSATCSSAATIGRGSPSSTSPTRRMLTRSLTRTRRLLSIQTRP